MINILGAIRAQGDNTTSHKATKKGEATQSTFNLSTRQLQTLIITFSKRVKKQATKQGGIRNRAKIIRGGETYPRIQIKATRSHVKRPES